MGDTAHTNLLLKYIWSLYFLCRTNNLTILNKMCVYIFQSNFHTHFSLFLIITWCSTHQTFSILFWDSYLGFWRFYLMLVDCATYATSILHFNILIIFMSFSTKCKTYSFHFYKLIFSQKQGHNWIILLCKFYELTITHKLIRNFSYFSIFSHAITFCIYRCHFLITIFVFKPNILSSDSFQHAWYSVTSLLYTATYSVLCVACVMLWCVCVCVSLQLS